MKTHDSRFFCLLVLMFLARLALSAAGDESNLAKVSYDDAMVPQIPVTLFQKPAFFVVDTGASGIFIDASYEKELGLPIDNDSATTITSTQTPLLVYMAPLLTIGDHGFILDTVGCLDFSYMPAIIGCARFDGALGMDLLERYVATFDPDKAQFILSTSVPAIVKKSALAIPLTAIDPRQGLELQGYINDVGPVNLKLDTGNSAFLSLNQADWEKVSHGKAVGLRKSLTVGASNSQPLQTKEARAQSLRIGTNIYTNIIMDISSNSNRESSVGYGFLKQHIATLDVSNRVLYLIPSRHFGENQEADMSGLHIIKVDSKIVISAIERDMPAYQVGMRAGQELVSINGKSTASWSLQEIRNLLRKKDGLEMKVAVKQGDQVKKVTFHLKKMI